MKTLSVTDSRPQKANLLTQYALCQGNSLADMNITVTVITSSCLTVRLSGVDIALKRLKLGSRNICTATAQVVFTRDMRQFWRFLTSGVNLIFDLFN